MANTKRRQAAKRNVSKAERRRRSETGPRLRAAERFPRAAPSRAPAAAANSFTWKCDRGANFVPSEPRTLARRAASNASPASARTDHGIHRNGSSARTLLTSLAAGWYPTRQTRERSFHDLASRHAMSAATVSRRTTGRTCPSARDRRPPSTARDSAPSTKRRRGKEGGGDQRTTREGGRDATGSKATRGGRRSRRAYPRYARERLAEVIDNLRADTFKPMLETAAEVLGGRVTAFRAL
jgi:hypothetical protein